MASADFISREAAITTYKTFGHLNLHNAIEAFNEIPAADVVEVVRCKDCTHCKKGKALECEKHNYAWNNMRRWVDEDDFCKWGVKREEN